MIHISWLEMGWDATRLFMNLIQKVTNNWLVATSFSIGIADTVADTDTIHTIEGIIDDAKGQVCGVRACVGSDHTSTNTVSRHV